MLDKSKNDIKFETLHHCCIRIHKKIHPDKAIENGTKARPSRHRPKQSHGAAKQDKQTCTRPGQGGKERDGRRGHGCRRQRGARRPEDSRRTTAGEREEEHKGRTTPAHRVQRRGWPVSFFLKRMHKTENKKYTAIAEFDLAKTLPESHLQVSR